MPVDLKRSVPAFAVILLGSTTALAGVVNPNISVIGQPVISLTDDPDDPAHDRPILEVGETEFMFDDYLNPYVRGTVLLSLSQEEGMVLEEGYFSLDRGLPAGLSLRGGQYRLGFGKLNSQHPHALPFAERFAMPAAYLPGEESFNEMAFQLSKRLPAPGEVSLVASVDWLKGDTFLRERDDSGLPNDPLTTAEGDLSEQTRSGVLARLSAFAMVGERSGLEMGLSATEGTNNVAARTRTRIFGADVKAKLWNSENSYLLLQGEALKLDRQDAGWDGAGYTKDTVTPWGWHLYADYNFNRRWNLGASCERFQQDDDRKEWNHSVGLFAGFALMEETTVLRLDWRREQLGVTAGETQPDAINTATMRVVWSMGPHKAHQF
jgi:hypothetical protein